MQSSRDHPNPDHVKGWILDVYPSALGEFAVWIIAKNGERLRLTDSLKPKIYISGREDSLEKLASQFPYDGAVVSWDFVRRHAKATNLEESRVLEVTLKDCRTSPSFSARAKNYKQMVSQVIAAKQLIKEGAEVATGKNVKFLFISAENKRYERRVTAEELIEKNTNSDVKKYLLLLYASAVHMFSPFGYSASTIYDEVRGHQQVRLTESELTRSFRVNGS